MCFNATYCSVGRFRWKGSQGLLQSLILALSLIKILEFYCLLIQCTQKLGGKAGLFTGVLFWRLFSQRKKPLNLLLISGIRYETKLIKILNIWANETPQGRVSVANLTLSIKKLLGFALGFYFMGHGIAPSEMQGGVSLTQNILKKGKIGPFLLLTDVVPFNVFIKSSKLLYSFFLSKTKFCQLKRFLSLGKIAKIFLSAACSWIMESPLSFVLEI